MKDFARAWLDVIQTHAIQNKVDFVLIAGDFFNARKVEPEAMNHAIAGLELLREAGIPVVAIEGNHDQRDLISDYSWMRSLSRWGYLKLLEPAHDEEGHLALIPWDEEEGRGSYLDIAGARIFGTHWYGTSANAAIPLLADALRRARGEDRFNILLLHTDVEGQLSRPNIPALSLDTMKKLQSLVDYLALGHTHKRFEIDNWAFNPGSLEACSIDEYREERGLYLVEVDDERRIRAQHLRDYIQRPFQRLSFDVSGVESPDAVYEGVLETVRREARARVAEDGNDTPAPIIEINLRGHLGFKNSLLDIARIRADAREQTGALHVMITNRSIPVEYAVAAGLDADASRQVRERRIIEDLIARDNRYKTHAHEMAQLVLDAKRLALSDEAPEEILKTIEDHLTKHGLAQALESSAAPNEPELIASTAALGALERNATT